MLCTLGLVVGLVACGQPEPIEVAAQAPAVEPVVEPVVVGPVELDLELPASRRDEVAERARAAVEAQGLRHVDEIAVDLTCESSRCTAHVVAQPAAP